MELIDKSTSMWGWGRIMATAAAFIAFGAIAMGQPDAAPDTAAITSAGSEVIDAVYVLIAKVGVFASAALTLWSKVRPLMPWIKADGTKKK